MAMSHSPLEHLNPLQVWQVRIRIVTSGNNYIIEQFDRIFFCIKLRVPHLKLRLLVDPLDIPGDAVEFDEFPEAFLLESFHEIPFVDFSWEIRGDWFPEVVVKSIVWELERLLGEIGPELAVHAGVDVLAVFVGGAPP